MEAANGDVIAQGVTSHLDIIELPFYYLGLNTVLKRFLAGTGAMGGLLFLVKPDALFTPEGTPRPWKLTSDSSEATAIPWWFYCVGTGAVLATFV